MSFAATVICWISSVRSFSLPRICAFFRWLAKHPISALHLRVEPVTAGNRTENYVLKDVVGRLRQELLYFQNVLLFMAQSYISLTQIRKIRLSHCRFSRNSCVRSSIRSRSDILNVIQIGPLIWEAR